MALTLALLADCQKILNQLLNRNRLAWSATGGTGANQIKAFPFDEEIDAALLRADGLVITEVYFQAEQSFRNRFMVTSGLLADGDKVPEFSGLIGKCEYSPNIWVPTVSLPYLDVGLAVDTITITGHTLLDGAIVRMTTTDTMPNTAQGLLTSTENLYVVVIDEDIISLTRTAGGPHITYTDRGLGTHTLTAYPALSPSREQLVKDDIVGANQSGSYVGASAFAGMHHFQDGYVFHTSGSFRMSYPEYVRTSVLQSLQQHEPLVICWAAELLYKQHANAGFDWYRETRKELAAAVYAGSMRLKAPQPLPANLRG